MFKTDFRATQSLGALFVVLSLCHPLAGHTQTIGEVAERQRAKLQAEANPAPQVPTAPSSTPKPTVKPKKTASSTWRLHGVYGIGDHISADVLNGDQLQRVQAGSTLGHYTVVKIGLFSMQLQTTKGCGRKCPTNVTVALGGTF